jgi:hypothetical protein
MPINKLTDKSITPTFVTDKLGFTPLSESDVAQQINDLVDSAPQALDTLNELAAALGDDANFAHNVYASGNAVPLENGNVGVFLTGYDASDNKYVYYAEMTKDLSSVTVSASPLLTGVNHGDPGVAFYNGQYHMLVTAREASYGNWRVEHWVSDSINSGWSLVGNAINNEYNGNDSIWLEGASDSFVLFEEKGVLYASVAGTA